MFNYPRRNRTGFKRWIPSFKQFILLGLIGAFVLFISLALAVRFIRIPEPSELSKAQATILYFDDGFTEMARLGEANRVAVTIDQVPLFAQRVVLSAEDRQFFEHGGFSLRAIGRAILNNAGGSSTQGGSTITQQYSKNAYLTQDRTIVRKVKELLLSIKLETTISKDKILERYLNTIYFGRGAYGIESASTAYFGKSIYKLSVEQAAVLAALVQAPNGLAPETNITGLTERWNYVLNGMVKQGWLDSAERNNMKFPSIKPFNQRDTYGGTRGYLVEQTRKALLAQGITENEINRAGYRVVTTFNRRAQAAAVAAVNAQGPKSGTEGLRIGLASVRPGTGEVVALYGGKDFLKDQLNNATQAIGQAGSTFKAFTLAAALENKITLANSFSGINGTRVGTYRVTNYSNSSFGSSISLLRATEQSVNTAFVQVADKVGPEVVKQAAIRAGIPSDTVGLVPNLTFTLGTASPKVIDIAASYATFAARGIQVNPSYIRSITSPMGENIFTLTPEKTKAFTQRISDSVSYALQQVVNYGTGTPARALGRPAAGKTGTTNDNMSSWFAGFTPEFATAVMLVKDDANGQPMTLRGTGGLETVYGGSFPCRIWTAYMQGALKDMPITKFPPLPPNQPSGWAPSPSASKSVKPSVTPSTKPTPTPSKSASPTNQPTASVPNLIGDIETARTNAANAGLTLSEVPLDETVDLTLPLYVVSQSAASGSQVAIGSSVLVQVSNSPL